MRGTNDIKHIGNYPVVTKTVYLDTEKGKKTPFQKMTYEFDFQDVPNLPPDDEIQIERFRFARTFWVKAE